MLPKDPNDFRETRFAICNGTDVLVHVHSKDATLNGESVFSVYLYVPSISPGKCAIVPLSDSDGLLVDGSAFSMRIVVKDIDSNTLLLTSQAIEIQY